MDYDDLLWLGYMVVLYLGVRLLVWFPDFLAADWGSYNPTQLQLLELQLLQIIGSFVIILATYAWWSEREE